MSAGNLPRRLAIAASCGILRRLVPRRAAWYFCGALVMVESPRLVGRDIRTLLCAPQPSRGRAACGRTHIAPDALGSPCLSARRSRRDPLARAAAPLAAIAVLHRLWKPGGRRAAPSSVAQAATSAAAAAAEKAQTPRPSARRPTWPSLDKIVAPLQDYPLSADDNTKLNAAFKALAAGDADEGARLQAGDQRSARPHAHRVGAAAPRQGHSRRLPQVPSREPRLAEPRATAAAHGRDAVRRGRRHRRHRHLLHRPRSTQPRRHGRARLGAHRARREGQGEGAGREDLAREGSAGQPREGLPRPASARCSTSRTTSGASTGCWSRT